MASSNIASGIQVYQWIPDCYIQSLLSFSTWISVSSFLSSNATCSSSILSCHSKRQLWFGCDIGQKRWDHSTATPSADRAAVAYDTYPTPTSRPSPSERVCTWPSLRLEHSFPRDRCGLLLRVLEVASKIISRGKPSLMTSHKMTPPRLRLPHPLPGPLHFTAVTPPATYRHMHVYYIRVCVRWRLPPNVNSTLVDTVLFAILFISGA